LLISRSDLQCFSYEDECFAPEPKHKRSRHELPPKPKPKRSRPELPPEPKHKRSWTELPQR
jgi:hypothetical protein